jgi:parvulin-like peptidyl-prolyl isomerase
MRHRHSLFVVLALLSSCGQGTDSSVSEGSSERVPPDPIMPVDETPAPVVPSHQGSSGDASQILVQLGELHIDGARFHARAVRKKPTGEHLNDEEKRSVLEELIDELQLTRAARDAGLLSHSLVEARIVSTLIQKEVLSEVDALRYKDAELKAWYEAHREEMIHPARVHLGMITIRAAPKRTDMEALSRIQAIHTELVEKPPMFSTLAAQHSEDLWSQRRGVVGWIPSTGKVGVEEHVLELAFSQEAGQLSEPIQTSRGWALIKTLDFREPQERDWQRSKGDVMRAMKEEKVEIARTALLAQLREGAQIEILLEPTDLDLFGPLQSMPETVLARVNGTPITHAQLGERASRSFPPGTTSLSPDERRQTLDWLIDFELLLHEGIRQGLERDEDVESRLHSLLAEKVVAESQIMEISEADLLDYFHSHLEEFEQAPRVQLRRILLKIDANRSETDAISLLESIRREADADANQFTALARTHSEDQYAGGGGFMGWISQQPRPGLSAADLEIVFSLEVGEISDPHLSSSGAVLYQVVQSAPGRRQRFEDAMSNIRRKIEIQRKSELLEAYTQEVRTAHTVVIDEAMLAEQVVIYATPPNMAFPTGR